MDAGEVQVAISGRDEFSAASRSAEESYERLRLAQARAKSGTNALSASIDRLRARVALVGAAMGGFATITTSLAVGPERAFTRINALVGRTEKQVTRLRVASDDLARSTALSTRQLAEGAFDIASAGLRGADATETLRRSANAAAVGLGEARTVADATTSAMLTYGTANLNAAAAVDTLVAAVREGKASAESFAPQIGRIASLAQQLEVDYGELLGTLAFLTRRTGDASLATEQLLGVFRKLLRPTQIAKEMLASYGLTAQQVRKMVADDLIGTVETLTERMQQAGHNIADFWEETSAVVGAGLLVESAREADQVIQSVTKSSGSLARAVQTTFNRPFHEAATAATAFHEALVNMGQAIEHSIAPVLRAVATTVNAITAAFEALPRPVRTAIVVVTAALFGLVTVSLLAAKIAVGWGLVFATWRRVLNSTALGINTTAAGARGATRAYSLLGSATESVTAATRDLYHAQMNTITAVRRGAAASQEAAFAREAEAKATLDAARANMAAAATQRGLVDSRGNPLAGATGIVTGTNATKAQASALRNLGSAVGTVAKRYGTLFGSLAGGTALIWGLTAAWNAAREASARKRETMELLGREIGFVRVDVEELRQTLQAYIDTLNEADAAAQAAPETWSSSFVTAAAAVNGGADALTAFRQVSDEADARIVQLAQDVAKVTEESKGMVGGARAIDKEVRNVTAAFYAELEALGLTRDVIDELIKLSRSMRDAQQASTKEAQESAKAYLQNAEEISKFSRALGPDVVNRIIASAQASGDWVRAASQLRIGLAHVRGETGPTMADMEALGMGVTAAASNWEQMAERVNEAMEKFVESHRTALPAAEQSYRDFARAMGIQMYTAGNSVVSMTERVLRSLGLQVEGLADAAIAYAAFDTDIGGATIDVSWISRIQAAGKAIGMERDALSDLMKDVGAQAAATWPAAERAVSDHNKALEDARRLIDRFLTEITRVGDTVASSRFRDQLLGDAEQIQRAFDGLIETIKGLGPHTQLALQQAIAAMRPLIDQLKTASNALHGTATTQGALSKLAETEQRLARAREAAGVAQVHEVDALLEAAAKSQRKISELESELESLRQQAAQHAASVQQNLTGAMSLVTNTNTEAAGYLSYLEKFAAQIDKLAGAGFPNAMIQEVIGLGLKQGYFAAKRLLSMDTDARSRTIGLHNRISEVAGRIGDKSAGMLPSADRMADLPGLIAAENQRMQDFLTEALDLAIAENELQQGIVDGLRAEMAELATQIQDEFATFIEDLNSFGELFPPQLKAVFDQAVADFGATLGAQVDRINAGMSAALGAVQSAASSAIASISNARTPVRTATTAPKIPKTPSAGRTDGSSGAPDPAAGLTPDNTPKVQVTVYATGADPEQTVEAIRTYADSRGRPGGFGGWVL